MADAVSLSAAIEALRTELSGAMLFGHGVGFQFELQPIELTLQVGVTSAGDGKIGWKVFEVGGSWQSMSTQTLKLVLNPVWKRSDGTVVRDFTIADEVDAPPSS